MPPKKAVSRPARRSKRVDALERTDDAVVYASSEPVAPIAQVPPAHASLSAYRRIALGFVFVVAAVLGVVLYVSTVQATIRIVPVEEAVRADFILDVVPTPTRESEVRGKVVSGTLGKAGTFTPSGEGKKEVEGVARGKVTIFNTTSGAQTLIKTTRLLTPEGVLFRIDETVNVPAKGKVDVAAYADQPGKTGDIAPTKFTIPGLPESLRKSIYAESTAPFVGGLASVAVVSQADIDKAVSALTTKIEEDAKAMLREEAGTAFTGESFSSEATETKVSVAAGQEAAQFDVSLTLKVQGVFYDKDALQAVAVRKLFDELKPGKEFKTVNTAGLQAKVEKADETNNTANIRVYLDGIMIPSSTNAALNPGRFMGMKQEEVKEALVREGLAKDVQVTYFPPFIGRIPRLKDHIYVEIVK
jgi:hypothetical protein